MKKETTNGKTFEEFPQQLTSFFSDRNNLRFRSSPEGARLIWPFKTRFIRSKTEDAWEKRRLKGLPRDADPITVYAEHCHTLAKLADDALWGVTCAWYWTYSRFKHQNELGSNGVRKGNGFRIRRGEFKKFVASIAAFDRRFFFPSWLWETVIAYVCLVKPDFLKDGGYMPDVDGQVPFPFEHLGLVHMGIVRSMDERLELLRHLDQWKYRSLPVFCDYVLNWIAGYNQKYGEKYRMRYVKNRQYIYGKDLVVVNLESGNLRGDAPKWTIEEDEEV